MVDGFAQPLDQDVFVVARRKAGLPRVGLCAIPAHETLNTHGKTAGKEFRSRRSHHLFADLHAESSLVF
jgi:hypothetical protein